jgi:hypothetical protein
MDLLCSVNGHVEVNIFPVGKRYRPVGHDQVVSEILRQSPDKVFSEQRFSTHKGATVKEQGFLFQCPQGFMPYAVRVLVNLFLSVEKKMIAVVAAKVTVGGDVNRYGSVSRHAQGKRTQQG